MQQHIGAKSFTRRKGLECLNIRVTYTILTIPTEGIAIIINNTKFSPETRQDDRKGADNDAQNMHDTFKFLGFDVKSFKNLTTTEMLKELQTGKLQLFSK